MHTFSLKHGFQFTSMHTSAKWLKRTMMTCNTCANFKAIQAMYRVTQKVETFEKPNKNRRNPRKKIY